MPSNVETLAEPVAVTQDDSDPAAYCAELIRNTDKDRYLTALFAPEDKRDSVMALYAFNSEVARIREVVSEPAMGEFRLQWWRDTIENIYDDQVPDHPVAIELSKAIEGGDLPKKGLINLIEARAFDLYDDPMPSLDALEGYLGETSSAVIQMASLILAGPQASEAANAAGHAGVAYGLVGLMRSLPLHRSRGQCFLPKDVLARADLAPVDIIAGKRKEAITIVLRELRQVALNHLLEARDHTADVPPAALPAFLPVSLVELYLKRLGRMRHNAVRTVAEVQQIRRQWKMLTAALFQTY